MLEHIACYYYYFYMKIIISVNYMKEERSLSSKATRGSPKMGNKKSKPAKNKYTGLTSLHG